MVNESTVLSQIFRLAEKDAVSWFICSWDFLGCFSGGDWDGDIDTSCYD